VTPTGTTTLVRAAAEGASGRAGAAAAEGENTAPTRIRERNAVTVARRPVCLRPAVALVEAVQGISSSTFA
jgi:hypothetical protein